MFSQMKIDGSRFRREDLAPLVQKLRDVLDIAEIPKDKITFLKTLLNDYIVLTR